MSERGGFRTSSGFVLAAAGSAVGLGNIWRFPYVAGEGGGAMFVLVYLLWVVAIGVPVLVAELALGRAHRRGIVGAISAVAPRSRWPWLGRFCVLTAFAILAFYAVVAGWTLAFFAAALAGGGGADTMAASRSQFAATVADPTLALGTTALVLVLTGLVVARGIESGVERASKVLMPLLFVVLVALAIHAVSLPGADAGLSFLWIPRIEDLDADAVGVALGQALFSLSLGVGGMTAYGSYLTGRENLVRLALIIASTDTLVALLGGLIAYPALFSAGGTPTEGPALVFVTMPTVFAKIPGGAWVSPAFYALLALAAVTSTISLLEVVVCHLVDDFGVRRSRATWSTTGAAFALAVPSALSQGAVPALGDLGGLGIDHLELQSTLFGTYGVVLGALGIALFVGRVWGPSLAEAEVGRGADTRTIVRIWSLCIRWSCPLAILAVLAFVAAQGGS